MMNVAKKPMTESNALNHIAAKCAAREYCLADIRKMLSRWELPDGAEERIMQRLQAEKYVDERRYAHAYVRDKFRYNHWGVKRIELELRRKGIALDIIEDAKAEINDEDNTETLRHIIEVKRRTVKGNSEYEIRAKLFRFALSRGFSYEDISEVLVLDE